MCTQARHDKSSNNSVLNKADNRTSNQSLGRNRANSAPKVNHKTMKNISQPALEAVVLEDQDQVRIPEETELNNSQLTVNSVNSIANGVSDDQTKHANGNGKSIQDEGDAT